MVDICSTILSFRTSLTAYSASSRKMPVQVPPVVTDPRQRISLTPLDLSTSPKSCRDAQVLSDSLCAQMIRDVALCIYRHEKCTSFWSKNVRSQQLLSADLSDFQCRANTARISYFGSSKESTRTFSSADQREPLKTRVHRRHPPATLPLLTSKKC